MRARWERYNFFLTVLTESLDTQISKESEMKTTSTNRVTESDEGQTVVLDAEYSSAGFVTLVAYGVMYCAVNSNDTDFLVRSERLSPKD